MSQNTARTSYRQDGRASPQPANIPADASIQREYLALAKDHQQHSQLLLNAASVALERAWAALEAYEGALNDLMQAVERRGSTPVNEHVSATAAADDSNKPAPPQKSGSLRRYLLPVVNFLSAGYTAYNLFWASSGNFGVSGLIEGNDTAPIQFLALPAA